MRASTGLMGIIVPALLGCGGGGGAGGSVTLSGDDVTVAQDALASSTALADCVVAATRLLQFTPVVPESDLDTHALFAQLFQCPTLAPDSPTRASFDWGSGCLGRDGRTRRGRMTVDVTGAVLEPLPGVLAVTGYGDDHSALDGSADVNFAVAGVIKFTLTGLRLTMDQTYDVKGELSVTLAAAPDPLQTRYEVGGSGSVGGVAFTIETPLRVQQDCAHPVSGTMTIELDGNRTAHADFGGDTCDDVVALTVGESWQEVHLE
ncbi:MAG: hypothetical protein U1E76_13895 [Planctomycetota bacterium]